MEEKLFDRHGCSSFFSQANFADFNTSKKIEQRYSNQQSSTSETREITTRPYNYWKLQISHLNIDKFIIFRHIYSMEGKSATQNTQSEGFLTFTC